MPSADTPAQIPMARPRSRASVNTLVSTDNVDGMMNAPPTPMSARVAISTSASVANADSSEPIAEHGQAERERLVATEAVTEAARREQQSREHDRVRVDDPLQLTSRRAETAVLDVGCASVGNATLRIVLSSTITIRLTHSTSNVNQRRWCTNSGSLSLCAQSSPSQTRNGTVSYLPGRMRDDNLGPATI